MKLLILLFFFLSGACGLIYEVVWTKLFALSMGGTTFAISTVLAAFMGGLAFGSRYGGKWIDRRGNPLVAYGLIEGAIGLYCLVVPPLVNSIPALLSPFYDNFYNSNLFLFGFMRFFLCVAILIFPTALMGASLPVLSKYYAGNKLKFGWEIGRLYAINTLGAGVGAFVAGFILLPFYGKTFSIHFAAAINIGICAVIMFIWAVFFRNNREAGAAGSSTTASSIAASAPDTSSHSVWGKSVLIAALAVYFVNGFAGMAYQVAWTRALTLSIGASAYSFSIIVTVFIFGLAAGGAIGARIADRLRDPASAMGWTEICVGFSATWVMWGLGQLPKWIGPIISRFSANWNTLLSVEFALVGALILLPTLFMGAVFPLAIKTVGLCRSGVGEPVGLAYGVNTLGAIAGSVAAGFVLMPSVGLQNTITIANALNWLAGACLLAAASSSRGGLRWLKSAAPLFAGILLTILMPRWDKAIMNSGPFIYEIKESENRQFRKKEELLFYKDDADTTVTVFKFDDGRIFLRVNGKTDASTGRDMTTQELSGHIPMLMHPNPKKVCVVGLASGVTLGAITRYNVDSVDSIELSSAVVEAANIFKPWNYDAMHDPRVLSMVGDGRNHLSMTKKKYDVIISEPSNPWIAGEAALFTREYFESALERLNPGGIFCCWLQGYNMAPDEFVMLMRTFQSVFHEATLWETLNTMDFMLVGSENEISIDLASIRKRIEEPKIKADLDRVNIASVPELLGKFILGPRHFVMVSGEGDNHIDDLLQLEYRAPKYIYQNVGYYPELFNRVMRYREDPGAIVQIDPEKAPEGYFESIDREVKVRNLIQSAALASAQGQTIYALDNLAEAISINSRNEIARDLLKNTAHDAAFILIKRGNVESAFNIYMRTVNILPEDSEIRMQMAACYMIMGKTDEGYEQFLKAIELNSDNHIALYSAALIEIDKGEVEKAKEKLRKSLEIVPDFAPAKEALEKIAQ